MSVKIPSLLFQAKRRVELVDWPFDDSPPAAGEAIGRTVLTLVSPGTEVTGAFERERKEPAIGGYAAIIDVEQVGLDVTNIKPGDRVFALGQHKAKMRFAANQAWKLPEGVSPEVAAFTRLAGVSWTTLTTTAARPADRVVIVGLGIIGNLAAQIFSSAGYRVTALDLDERRRSLGQQVGLNDVRQSIAENDTEIRDRAALVVDCTGHEQAVIDACGLVRKGGEVVLVGVPWRPRSAALAFDVLHPIFHRYVTIRSGWEWSLPWQDQDFANGSLAGNFASAMAWLADGRIKTNGLAQVESPADGQRIFEAMLSLKYPTLTAIFDWSKV